MGDSDIQRRHLCYDARSLSSDSPIVINKRRLKHLWTPASNEIDTTPKTTTNEQRKKERKTFMDEKNSFQKMFIIRVRVGSSQRVAPWPTNTAIYWFCCGTLLVRKCASPGTWLSQSNNSFWALSLPILSCLCWLTRSWYSVSKRKYIYRYWSALLRVESGLRFGGWAREPLLGAGIVP